MKNKSVDRIDKRKIPYYFRAIERDSNPVVYFGILLSDNGFNFACHASKDTDESQFHERILNKREFSFSKISKDDFVRNAKRALFNMKKEALDAKMKFEAKEHVVLGAIEKLREIEES